MMKRIQFLRNVPYILSQIRHYQPSLFGYIAGYTLFYGISPLIWVIAPKILIDALEKKASWQTILLILGCAFVLAALSGFMMEFLRSRFRMQMNNVRYRMIEKLSAHAMKMNFQFTEAPDAVDTYWGAAKMVSSPMHGFGTIVTKLFSLFGSLAGLIGLVWALCHIHIALMIGLTATVVISFLMNLKTTVYEQSQHPQMMRFHHQIRYISSTLTDFAYGKELRVFPVLDLFRKRVKNMMVQYGALETRIGQRREKADLVSAGMIFLRDLVIPIYLGFRLYRGALSLGDFAMSFAAVSGFAGWLDTMLIDLRELFTDTAAFESYREYLNLPCPNETKHITLPMRPAREIRFDHVSFAYPNSDRLILDDLNLTIHAGERLALVGINGAGKTTIVKLMTGLYAPTQGTIFIDGVDASQLGFQARIALFSVILQEVKIFPFSIAENITLSPDEADPAILKDALRQCGLEEKIATLSQGTETSMLKILDESGVEFSGGQNQKLMIARGIYRQGSVLVMDEPTAALDALAESRLYQQLNGIIENRTAVYISHRLASTRFCDRIVLLENGKVREDGSHDTLMNLHGAYAEMFEVQSQYYEKVERVEEEGGEE